MGRVRTKTAKKSSRQDSRMTLDFHTNKKILEEVAIIPSKRLRNKIAKFSTHLMKRIQRGPVRGISLKLQEEERERRMDFVPDESAINISTLHWECCKKLLHLVTVRVSLLMQRLKKHWNARVLLDCERAPVGPNFQRLFSISLKVLLRKRLR